MTKRQAMIRALSHAADLIRDASDNGHESLIAIDGVGPPYVSKADSLRVIDACSSLADSMERRLFRLQDAEKRAARGAK